MLWIITIWMLSMATTWGEAAKPKCKNPSGVIGQSGVKACFLYKCVARGRRKAIWKKGPFQKKECCKYDGKTFKANETITKYPGNRDKTRICGRADDGTMEVQIVVRESFCQTASSTVPQTTTESPTNPLCPHLGISARTSDPSTWPPGFLPSEKANISIDFPLLLDRASPRLASVTITGGGRLVFSPTADIAKLIAHYVLIENGGSLEIGREDCPFTGRAEILLIGKRGEYNVMGNGEKFVGVQPGGRLEIHGKPKIPWTKLTSTIESGTRTLHLSEDVSSWENGDVLVLSSTDFDMDQAETQTVESCSGNVCTLQKTVAFTHFGEVDNGVDMRGEVGILSRNVLIHGEMEEQCYGDQRCDLFKKDTFGGHVIVRKGFGAFKVEHAELTNMGQQGVLARYPLHWHMADNLPEGASYVKSNSIHHNHHRCVTCHGSMGCIIENNVAYETLGHCYFMEDGVEEGVVMKGNLGLNTRAGSMIPSDADPATFWITHPKATITNNVAGGSIGKGFWFLYPSLPTGIAKFLQEGGRRHYFQEDELFRTPLTDISNNVAHSTPFGYFFDSFLTEDQDASDANSGKFFPREVPLDPRSSPVTTYIRDLTCYKNYRTCIWMHLERGHYTNIRVAEAKDLMFVHESSEITDSIFVGFSDKNLGHPNRRINGSPWPRSLPKGGLQFGLRYYQNPSLVTHSEFRSFNDIAPMKSRAIGLKRAGSKSIWSGGKNLTFTGTPTQCRMADHRTDNRQFLFRDLTGSITSHPGASIVRNIPHLVSDRCAQVPQWGPLSICPHGYISTPVGKKYVNFTAIQRDDIHDQPFTPVANDNYYYFSTDHSYIFSITANLPKSFSHIPFQFAGVDAGTNMRFGICLPIGASIMVTDHTPVGTIGELMIDDTGTKYYHDEEVGIVFLKVVGSYVRTIGDVSRCGLDNSACLTKVISVTGPVADRAADCRHRDLSKYAVGPLDTSGALSSLM